MNSVLNEIIKKARKNANYLQGEGEVFEMDSYCIDYSNVPKELKAAYIEALFARDEKIAPLLRAEIESLTVIWPKLEDGSYGMGMMLGGLINAARLSEEEIKDK